MGHHITAAIYFSFSVLLFVIIEMAQSFPGMSFRYDSSAVPWLPWLLFVTGLFYLGWKKMKDE
ncbi:hypothetical protein [Halobacillus litoralis]|uniref:hypothetical protein n=1 Tax=Halobacillus litoralis TaxID=45668 RepID=UPI001CD74CBC|nr:hypothetical protein [Halobacillus litoralis]MCA1023639.1 hypothetical protein [Halobacillus litoralis]